MNRSRHNAWSTADVRRLVARALVAGMLATAGCGTTRDAGDAAPRPGREPGPAAGGQAPSTAVTNASATISLDEATAAARANSPELARRRIELQIAETIARGEPAETELRFGYGREDPVDGETVRTAVRYYPSSPWLALDARAARDAAIELARAGVAAEIRRIDNDVAAAYAELQYLEREASLRLELAELHRELLAIQRQRRDHGQATAIDVLATARRYHQVLADNSQLAGQRRRARQALARLVGRDAATLAVPPVAGSLAVAPEAKLNVETLTCRALRQRPDLGAAEWRHAVADYAVRANRRNRLPSLRFIQGSYTDRTEPVALGAADDSASEWRIDAAISLPFLAARPPADARTEADRRLFRLDADALRREIEAEVRNAVAEVEAANDDLRRHAADSAPILEELARLQREAAERPELTRADRVKLEATVIEARLVALRLAAAGARAQQRLERAVGGPD